MKKALILFFVLLLVPMITYAEENNFVDAKKIIDSKISCDQLSPEQLEELGDYYMEQIHPGQQHEIMDEMMGGEGSASLKQMHINMAGRIYCGYNTEGMMGSGAGMMGFGGMMNNMMGGGNMMGNYGSNYGMMGNYGYGINIFGWIVQLLVVIVLILLIFWLFQKVTKKK